MATVRLKDKALDDLERLPEVIHARVIKILQRLAMWPGVSGVKPLSGNLAGHFRMRTGDYRVQFVVQGDVVTVEKIGHLDVFYEE